MLNIGVIAICVTVGAAVGACVYAIIDFVAEAIRTQKDDDKKDGE